MVVGFRDVNVQLLLRAVLGQALAWWSNPARGADLQIRADRDMVVGPGLFFGLSQNYEFGVFFLFMGVSFMGVSWRTQPAQIMRENEKKLTPMKTHPHERGDVFLGVSSRPLFYCRNNGRKLTPKSFQFWACRIFSDFRGLQKTKLLYG